MRFYINENTYEVHKVTCDFVDALKYPHVVYFGEYSSSKEAIDDALKKGFDDADGCLYCCPESHTK